jgi:hypothetical protein
MIGGRSEAGRPRELHEVAARANAGEAFDPLLREFLDEVYSANHATRPAMIAGEPPPVGSVHDAYLAAVAEHLALRPAGTGVDGEARAFSVTRSLPGAGRHEGAAAGGKPAGLPSANDLRQSTTRCVSHDALRAHAIAPARANARRRPPRRKWPSFEGRPSARPPQDGPAVCWLVGTSLYGPLTTHSRRQPEVLPRLPAAGHSLTAPPSQPTWLPGSWRLRRPSRRISAAEGQAGHSGPGDSHPGRERPPPASRTARPAP